MNKWIDYIIMGGDMPDVTETWPTVPEPWQVIPDDERVNDLAEPVKPISERPF